MTVEQLKTEADKLGYQLRRKGYEGEPTIRWFNTPTRKIIQPNLFKERNPL